ncbi:MAG: tetratricopeptide repeat protein [Gammaproteobacteria bacterium]
MTPLLRSTFVLLLALLVACGGAEDRKSAYVNQGQELFEQGNFEKARIEFQNALQIDPKDLEARFKLAETLEKLENWQGAARQYLAILGEDENHPGALLNMGKLYLLSGADDKARENVEKLLAVDANNPGAKTLLAGVEAKAGDRDKARKLVEEVLAAKPNDPEAASLLASLQLVDGDVAGAVATLEGAIAAHPDEVALAINLARVHARAGDQDAAVATFRRVIEKKPDVLAYRNALARMLIGFKKLDEAEAVLKQSIADFPDVEDAKLAYIEFLSGTRGVDVAITELKKLIDENPDANAYRFALGKVYEATKQVDEAAGVYEGLIADIEEGPELLTAKNRLAVMRTRQGRLGDARTLVEEVLAENARDTDALILRGTLLLNEADAAGAIADLRTVLRDAPENAGAVRLLARAHLLNKEPELAIDVLRQGIESNPSAAVLGLDLANIYASQSKVEEALAALDGVLENNPAEPSALEGKFKILVFRKEFPAALEVAERLKQARPNDVRGYHFAGLVRQAQGDMEASIGEFQSALDQQPDAVQPLSQLIKSYLVLKRRDDAVAKLKDVIAAQPNHYVAHNLLGELHLAAKEFDEAEAEFKAAIEGNAKWPIPYRNLASVYAATDRRDEAVALMKEGIEATGGSALLLTGLASYFEQTGDLDSAIAEYEKALKENPKSELAANNLAMMLAEYREDEASLKRARELVTPLRNSTQAAYLDTVGWIEYKLGEYEQSRLYLEKAVEGAPEAGLMHYHLGMTYFALGNAVSAREHLQRAVESTVDFKGKDEARATLARLEEQG